MIKVLMGVEGKEGDDKVKNTSSKEMGNRMRERESG